MSPHSPISIVSDYIYTLLVSPWLLTHFVWDILLCILPWTRPTKHWSLNQAVRMRVVKLVLHYWSLLRAGDRLTLRPRSEGNRFEVAPPQSEKVYQHGVLYDHAIEPGPVGMTWKPARPPPAGLIKPDFVLCLHFHGGGFAIGNGRDSDTGYLAKTLIRHMGVTHVCTPQYRLSSKRNGRFPAQIQDALTSYLYLIRDRKIPASQIIFSGDSAGANIALGLLRFIHDHGQTLNIPAPAAVALWSPWVDVNAAIQQDMRQSPNYRTDFLNKEFGQWGAVSVSGYGAVDTGCAYLSPLHHPFKGNINIPMYIHGGRREVLCDDIEEFANRYREVGWNVHLVVADHCPHDILLLGPLIGFHKEAEEGCKLAGRFLARETGLKMRVPEDCKHVFDHGITNLDVLIIGAGISGINAAYRLQTEGPAGLTYAILEGRDSLGGTWDLFRYPGIRSDSDVYTFSFAWNPWKHKGTMASGDELKEYMTKSAQSQGIDQHILYRHQVLSANWRSDIAKWEFQVSHPGSSSPSIFRSRFVLLGTGYYDYKTPLETSIPGLSTFTGKIIHPQFWPKDYDYTNKHVVVIGSGATAVTIVPAMAPTVKRVTMLQRSPSYIFPLPSNPWITALLFAILPAKWAHYLNRLMWLWRSYLTTLVCRKFPALAKLVFRHVAVTSLPPSIPWDPHFKPKYNPWDQRVCACVDGDFFAALRSGKADVVTGAIKKITEKTIELESGESLQPDAIVTATGLKLRFGGGIKFSIDGKEFNWADKYAWRAAMLQDVPNLVFLTGYETASWTLGADVSAKLFVRVLHKMERLDAKVVVPQVEEGVKMAEKPMMSLSSTYLKTMREVLPKGGDGVWAPKSNYFADMAGAKWGGIGEGDGLHFY
ncbi:hypothetical protein QBC35DRAFT_525581 [Podospora australis]|uniref:Alpha/beta hydrolase fold-3 domain-containing protein n=1 Tax=Podospora australis TaxID=1536484 RepID=A0AAN7AFX2_9PEZI|nr:hypothetical protein QBC35DRAFT_525581 [Podospora australis]